MIKKLFILSAIIIACAGCQSLYPVAVEGPPEYRQVPFGFAGPLSNNGSKISFIADFKGESNISNSYMNKVIDKERYGFLDFEESAYEPVFKEVSKARSLLRSIVFKDVDLEGVTPEEAARWIDERVKRVSPDCAFETELFTKAMEILPTLKKDKGVLRVTIKCKNISAMDLIDKIGKLTEEEYGFTKNESVVNTVRFIFGLADDWRGENRYSINPKAFRQLFGDDNSPENVKRKFAGAGVDLSDNESKVIVWSWSCLVIAKEGLLKQVDKVLGVNYFFKMDLWSDEIFDTEYPFDSMNIMDTGEASKEMREKLDKIEFGEIEFDDVKVSDLLDYMAKMSRSLDPEGKGVEIELRLSKEDAEGEGNFKSTLSPSIDSINLRGALRYVCEKAKLKCKVGKDKIIVASRYLPLYPIETKYYPVVKYFDDEPVSEDDVKNYLSATRIPFCDGTSVEYIKEKKLFKATLTTDAFEKLPYVLFAVWGYTHAFIYEKDSQIKEKISTLKPGVPVMVKGVPFFMDCKLDGLDFKQPCFLIKDIEAIKNPVLPKLRKYEPANP
ncbi:MAG TPA: hypothetical protein DCZ94_06405 [Lentisphaeria bacterium]|nr:MAG: hypothetical protein A2X48_05810 [Lentisphaerae bacterium GWF2_49_21]HBC86569.1 hypothetical protein [Lentisphaeria bacterium]